MFDISWSELLILAVVTLLFVGPKDLPVFLRTLGRYMGVVKRQAAEFRTQFDLAMREAEMEALRKDVEDLRLKAATAVREALPDVPSFKAFQPDAKDRSAPPPSETPPAHNENTPPVANSSSSPASETPAAPPSAKAEP